MNFVVTFEGSITVRESSTEQSVNVGELIESHLDAVMDEFDKVDAQDPEIDLDLGTRRVKLSVLVSATNPDGAIHSASPQIRSAIHGAGGSTPDWPSTDDQAWSVRQVQMSVRPAHLVDA
jgi:hypothetical protein